MSPRIPLPGGLASRPFHIDEGADAGLGAKRMRGRDLDAPYPGTRRAAGGEASLGADCAAYALRMPPSGFFCSVTAARLHGIPVSPRHRRATELHVGVVAPARAPRVVGVVGHKYRIDVDEIDRRHGVPATAPVRTWCDLAARGSLVELVAAADHLLQVSHPMADIGELVAGVERHPGRRGRGLLRQAVELADGRAESPGESALRVALVLGGVTGFEVNRTIRAGHHVFRGDIVFLPERTVLEYDGDYHRDVDQWRRDLTRTSRLESFGWRVVRLGARDLDDEAELVRRIRRVLAAPRG